MRHHIFGLRELKQRIDQQLLQGKETVHELLKVEN